MPQAIVRPAAIGKKASGNLDFVGHFAVTMLPMGSEVFDDSDIPTFRGWVDRLLRFFWLV
jgi:hypothetical protein